MALTNHDDDTRERVQNDPEFARIWHETALGLLDGDDEDRRVAHRIFQRHFDLSDEEIRTLSEKGAVA